MLQPSYFEAHITIFPYGKSHEEMDNLFRPVMESGWHSSIIYDDELMGKGKRYYLTRRDDSYENLRGYIFRACEEIYLLTSHTENACHDATSEDRGGNIRRGAEVTDDEDQRFVYLPVPYCNELSDFICPSDCDGINCQVMRSGSAYLIIVPPITD